MFNKSMKAWSLLNHTPFDGCLLVFNANPSDWRVKAADFKRRHGIGFKVHAIRGMSTEDQHSRTVTNDLYVTIKV